MAKTKAQLDREITAALSGGVKTKTPQAPTTADNLDERMGEISDLVSAAEGIVDSLRTAETVEKASDFDANLDEAIAAAEALLRELKAVRS